MPGTDHKGTDPARSEKQKPSWKARGKRQDQQFYQPRRNERTTGFNQDIEETRVKNESSTESEGSKNKRSTQQFYSPRGQIMSDQESQQQSPISAQVWSFRVYKSLKFVDRLDKCFNVC